MRSLQTSINLKKKEQFFYAIQTFKKLALIRNIVRLNDVVFNPLPNFVLKRIIELSSMTEMYRFLVQLHLTLFIYTC